MNGCTINKYNIGVGRIEFKHVEIDKKISEAIQRSNQSEKHEASILQGRRSSLKTPKVCDYCLGFDKSIVKDWTTEKGEIKDLICEKYGDQY